MKKIFTQNLPKGGGTGISYNQVNWQQSVGNDLKFEYEGFIGTISIIAYYKNDKGESMLTIKYKENTKEISIKNFTSCRFAYLFKKETYKQNKDKYMDLTKIEFIGNGIAWNRLVGKNIYFKYYDIDIYLYFKSYDGNKYFTVVYNDEEFTLSKENVKNCNIATILGKFLKEYKYNVGDVIETKTGKIKILEQIKIEKGNFKGYIYECLIDGNINEIKENSINFGHGCNVCGHWKPLKGYNDIATTHPHLIKYFKNIEDAYTHTYGSDDKIWFKCPDCGFEKEMIINQVSKAGFKCKKCSDGIKVPNKTMLGVLEQLNIKFITEYSPDWIGLKRYDFYFKLNNNEYIIEMDGGLGHGNGDNPMSGQTAEESQSIDDYKDNIAKENDIEVIRIDCNYESNDAFEYIKNSILNDNRLKNLFDLSKIDWDKIEHFVYHSLVCTAVEYFNNGITVPEEIGNIIHLSHVTVCTYLKKATKLKMCDYDPEINTKKGLRQGSISNCKQTICIEYNLIYNSVKELAIELTKITGEYFNPANISPVCRGVRKTYKKLHFKFYEDYIKEVS